MAGRRTAWRRGQGVGRGGRARLGLALAVALVAGGAGCSKSTPSAPQAAPAEASARDVPRGAKAVAQHRPSGGGVAGAHPSPGGTAVAGSGEMRRRERAGIELAAPPQTPPKAGPKAGPKAPLNATDAGASGAAPAPPPLLTGPKVAKARAAWAFVRGPWAEAVRSGESKRYAALLREHDVNAVQERPDGTKILTRPTLLAFLQDAWGGKPGTVEVVAPEIEPTMGPEGEVQVRFFERQVRGKRCETAWRMLELVEAQGGGYLIATDQRLGVVACPGDAAARAKADHDGAVGLAAAHEDLVRTLQSPDDASKEQVAQAVLLLDVGMARETLTWAQLARDGSAAWARARLAKVEAELDNTRTWGRVGWVQYPDGDKLVYRKVSRGPGDDLWVLYALLRGMKGGM